MVYRHAYQPMPGQEYFGKAMTKRKRKAWKGKKGKRGYVYVMDLQMDNLYKIGMSKKWRRREKDLQAANPHAYCLLAYPVKHMEYVEYCIHWDYWEQRHSREIFELSADDLLNIRAALRLQMDKQGGNHCDRLRKRIKPHKQSIITEPKPFCLKCGEQMCLVEPKKGQPWLAFWGCPNYPRCNYKLNIDRETGRPVGGYVPDIKGNSPPPGNDEARHVNLPWKT